jgi:hypothetical protein
VIGIAGVKDKSAYGLDGESGSEKDAIPNKAKNSGQTASLELFEIGGIADEGGEKNFIGAVGS